jgi:hypothetical protein
MHKRVTQVLKQVRVAGLGVKLVIPVNTLVVADFTHNVVNRQSGFFAMLL